MRQFPSSNLQAHSHHLRNEICRLPSPQKMASVSSHLRNFAVAEVVGYIARLDGHPGILNPPTVNTTAAAFQQAHGKVENPFAHVIPSNMLLNGDSLLGFYQSAVARREIQRVFGMGVMAPEDWEEQAEFTHSPRENNVVDSITERHRSGGGLVDAFQLSGEAAVSNCDWNGSGKPKHDLGSLTAFISDIYLSIWVPQAKLAYATARSHLDSQLKQARQSNSKRLPVLEYRLEILQTQIEVFENEKSIWTQAALNVWKFTAGERWTAPMKIDRFEV